MEVAVIVASLNTAIGAAKRATSTVPIVMLAAFSPVELGFVQSLARPGGNVTGTLVQAAELRVKALEILKELAPGRTRVAILGNPANPGMKSMLAETARVASVLGMTVQFFEVTQTDDVMPALERIAASRAEVLLVSNDGVTESRLRDIMHFAIEHRVVAIGTQTLSTSVGGAMYYGSNLEGMVDRSASYVDRILRGAKPADLPVEQPTRYDLILNLKTLRAIGITVPPIVLMRATEVIE